MVKKNKRNTLEIGNLPEPCAILDFAIDVILNNLIFELISTHSPNYAIFDSHKLILFQKKEIWTIINSIIQERNNSKLEKNLMSII